MSILKVDNIRDNGSDFNDVVSFQNANGTENGRLCRAFVNFNGTSTVAIRANFNVSSITDNGTGDYTVNFTNAMSDANYASLLSLQSGGFEISLLTGIKKAGLYSTTQLQIISVNAATGASVDSSIYNISISR